MNLEISCFFNEEVITDHKNMALMVHDNRKLYFPLYKKVRRGPMSDEGGDK